MADVIPVSRPLIGRLERAAVDRVLCSGALTQGPEVAMFEREFGAAVVAGRACVAVSSGTAGAHLGLLAAGIGPGDEVIVPAFTFAATANSVALTGATPVFADIEPLYFGLDAGAVEAAITSRTAAIMPVHLFGHPAAMPELTRVADRYGLAVFEDAAQAHGATLDGRQVGTFGGFGMFSFYPTKNMTTGEGGMVACADPGLERRVRLLRNQGMAERYSNEIVGFNARMSDLHAAVGRVQLSRLPEWTERRRANARFFDEYLENVMIPTVAPGATHVYHQYTIRVTGDRDGFAAELLKRHGVGTGVYYPVPVHRLPAFGRRLDLPETEWAAAGVLSLPVHPALCQQDLDRIVIAVNDVAGAGA